MTISDDEWDRRVLCSDGNCIGIIGADGRCKTCGKSYEGELPLSETDFKTIADDEASESMDAEPEADRSSDPVEEPFVDDDRPADGDWENRTLCIDESCIGVVGPDGRCKECGKPYPKY
jgi:hypothetical protein